MTKGLCLPPLLFWRQITFWHRKQCWCFRRKEAFRQPEKTALTGPSWRCIKLFGSTPSRSESSSCYWTKPIITRPSSLEAVFFLIAQARKGYDWLEVPYRRTRLGTTLNVGNRERSGPPAFLLCSRKAAKVRNKVKFTKRLKVTKRVIKGQTIGLM